MVQRTKSRECARNKDVLILAIYLPSPYLHMGSGSQMKEGWSCCFLRLIKKAFDQKYITFWANLIVKTHKVVFGIKTSSAQPKMWWGEWHAKSWLVFNSLWPIKSWSTTLRLFNSLSPITPDAVALGQAPSGWRADQCRLSTEHLQDVPSPNTVA